MALVLAGVVSNFWLRPLDGARPGHRHLLLTPLVALLSLISSAMARLSNTPTRFLTGITTSGTPHLGNYVGSVRHSVRFSRRADVQSFYFLADYHALIKVRRTGAHPALHARDRGHLAGLRASTRSA